MYQFLYENKIIFTTRYIFDFCTQKQRILFSILIFNAVKHTDNVTYHLTMETRLLLKTCTSPKMQLPENTDKIFEKQTAKTGHVIKKDTDKTRHRPKAQV